MANLMNELTVKIGEWDSNIASYKNEYTNAQSEMERIDKDISKEISDNEAPNNTVLELLKKQREREFLKMSKAQICLSKIYGELSQGVSEIDGNMSKIEKAANGLIGMGSISQYAKVGLSSSAVKAELQNMKTTVLQLNQLKTKLIELGYKCNLEGGDDKPKVKSIWQENNPNKKR